MEYASNQIEIDITFLKQKIKECHVTLHPRSGLMKLLDNCDGYLLGVKDEVNYKAVLALNCLVYSLRVLNGEGIEFCQQLKSMNTGDFEYGGVSSEKEHFYKDFEFEIFCAALMIAKGVRAVLPSDTKGNDIFYKDIQIQCKHPDKSHLKKIKNYLGEFNKSLNEAQKYGVFMLGVDTYFQGIEPSRDILMELENLMAEEIPYALQGKKWIIGVCVTTTYYSFIENGVRIMRTGNGLHCERSGETVNKNVLEEVLQIVKCFNPAPAILVFEGGRFTRIKPSA